MRHIFFLTIALFSALAGSAQRVVDITAADADVVSNERVAGLMGGTIFPEYKYLKVKEGSPYYRDEWSKGTLVLEGGTAYHNLDIRIDLLNHEIHYKNADDQEMVLTTPCKQVILNPGLDARIFIPGKQWIETDKLLGKAWLQVLVNDKVSLLLDLRKKAMQVTGYASATAEETITDTEVYFLQKDGKLIPVTRWTLLPKLLADKKDQLTLLNKYIKEMDLTGDAPIEYADLVAYYNRL